jgi:hypothetical protein
MYARLARFEGGDLSDIEAEAEQIKEDIETVGSGGATHYLPPELARVTRRMELFLDREQGAVAVVVYCDTAQDAAEADRILTGMQPRRSGWGRRVSADVYEVVVDQATQGRRAA